MDSVSFRPCPLCGKYYHIEMHDAQRPMKEWDGVSAYIECTDCMVQVCGKTLKKAIEKWDNLTDLHTCHKCEKGLK